MDKNVESIYSLPSKILFTAYYKIKYLFLVPPKLFIIYYKAQKHQ